MRERGHMKHEWQRGNIKEILFPYLEQLIALIGLLSGTNIDRIVAIIDGCASFDQMKRSIVIADILTALKPTLRGDGVATIRPLEPDLIGDLFLSQSNIANETAVFVIGLDPYAVGTRLWRMIEDFNDDIAIVDRLTKWIEAFSQKANSVGLDMFQEALGRM